MRTDEEDGWLVAHRSRRTVRARRGGRETRHASNCVPKLRRFRRLNYPLCHPAGRPGCGVSFMFVNGAPLCPQEMRIDWRAGERDMKGALGLLRGTTLKMRSREIAELKDAIRVRHQCDALYVITIPMDDGGLSGWDGRVGVFELVGHPSAARCYAWSRPVDRGKEIVTCLVLPPVDSPRVAVLIWKAGNGSAN